MSSEAAIRKGKGIVANPEFVLAFGLCAFLGVSAVVSIYASWFHYNEEGVFQGIRIWAIVIILVLTVLMVIAGFLIRAGHGAEALFIGIVAIMGLLAGFVTIATIFLLWMAPADGSTMGVEGFGMPIVGVFISVLMVILAPAVIYGERILPIFVAFIAGVWGILSIIVFAMVVFIGVDG